MRAILLDDSFTVSAELAGLLEQAGFEVVARGACLDDLLEQVEIQEPDLVILAYDRCDQLELVSQGAERVG